MGFEATVLGSQSRLLGRAALPFTRVIALIWPVITFYSHSVVKVGSLEDPVDTFLNSDSLRLPIRWK